MKKKIPKKQNKKGELFAEVAPLNLLHLPSEDINNDTQNAENLQYPKITHFCYHCKTYLEDSRFDERSIKNNDALICEKCFEEIRRTHNTYKRRKLVFDYCKARFHDRLVQQNQNSKINNQIMEVRYA